MRKIIMMILVIALASSCEVGKADNTNAILRINAFSEGLAAIQNANGLWGYIDQTGKIVIPCEWESAGSFNKGIASIRKYGKYGCINSMGQLIVPCQWNGYSPISFSEGLAAVQNEDKLWGFIDMSGVLVIPCVWEGVLTPRFSGGLAAVEKDGKMGYINTNGDVVIPCDYQYASAFSHGFAGVQDKEGLFFIDTSGSIAFPEIPHATGLDSFREDGIAFLEFDDYTGIFIDTKGNTVCSLTAEYRYRSNFREGLAGIAKQNEQGEWIGCEGYIDRTGTIVIPLELHSSYHYFMSGLACVPDGPVSSADTPYGVINRSGTLVYPFSLDKVVEFKDTVTEAVQGEQFGAINTDGRILIPFMYDDVKVGDGIILCLKQNEISIFDYNGKALK